jgi:hypothetical protein
MLPLEPVSIESNPKNDGSAKVLGTTSKSSMERSRPGDEAEDWSHACEGVVPHKYTNAPPSTTPSPTPTRRKNVFHQAGKLPCDHSCTVSETDALAPAIHTTLFCEPRCDLSGNRCQRMPLP